VASVTLQNLTKTYPGTRDGAHAVQGIDLEIRDRELMVLVGPSGCGKSTTLRMIAGLEDVSAGTVAIDGRIVNDVPPKDRDIAMVFQNYALYPHMSVYDNMAFGLQIRKMPKPEIDRRVRAAAGMLGLSELLERKPKALSGGQRQRVAVGRAIVRQPKVFLFDEPLSNLDAKMRLSTRAEIARLHARLGATMIYVTHDQVEAMSLGDRICVMHDGRIMQVAPPLELYDRPANLFVAGFIGSPPMNFFRGRIERDGATARFVWGSGLGAGRLALAPELARHTAGLGARPLVLGIRPEALLVGDESTSGVAACESALDATVERTEAMGAETLLHLESGGRAFVARVNPERRFAAGQRVPVKLPADKVRLFDLATENALPLVARAVYAG
jgi:multiple sugar transport system ATP-binding protein